MRAHPPFAHLGPAAAAAFVYGAAALVWAVAGDVLPGGRWMAVHLFTLGMLSNLIVTMTDHFARTVTKAPGDGARPWRLALLNAGVLIVLVGRVQGWSTVVAVGATITLIAVMWLYLTLRRMRKRSLGARFAFVVRAYERACGAFVHGAVLGAVLGLGVIAGEWYAGVRLAHLTVNVLGWGGLVLLGTVVFFAPTVMRARMESGADRSARPALRYAAVALTVATVALIVTGAPGAYGTAARAVAAVAVAGYAAGTTVVCVPVLATARRAVPSPHAWMIAAACAWFPLATWVGAAAVAVDLPGVLDALGLVLLVGVLGQAILAALSYLLPMIAGPGAEVRGIQRARLDRLARARVLAFNAGVALLGAGVAASRTLDWDAALVTGIGWLLLVAAVAATVALAAAALRAVDRAAA